MPVITAQTGPSLQAQYSQGDTANPVQGQGEAQSAAQSDWQAALLQLDALLQAALPGGAQAQNAATPAQAMGTANAETAPSDETPAVPAGQPMQTPVSDLHTALRRLNQGGEEEQTDTPTQSDADESQAAPVVQAVEVNTALLRQLNAPMTTRVPNVTVEARAEMTVDGDVSRADRGARINDPLPQFSRTVSSAQTTIELAARIESGAPGALRIDGLVPTERPQALTVPVPGAQSTHEWAPLKLGDKSAQWGQQLLDTLRERVEMQVNQQVKQAHIRLDPPDMGRLELTVRLDGDHLSVQINANHAQLRDALLQTGERLRAALMPQHAGGVSVDVGQGAPDDRSGQPRGDQGILAGRRSSPELEADLNELAPAGWLNTLV